MLTTVIIFLVSMSLCVLIHEAGHYLAAKAIGVYTYEFALGFGPKLLSWKPKETEFTLRLLPLGGFVAAAGESDDDGQIEVPFERTLPAKKPLPRLFFFLAGIFNNIVFALILMTFVIWAQGGVDTRHAVVGGLMEGKPAALAGLQIGDQIIAVGEDEVTDWNSLLDTISKQQGKTAEFHILRNGQSLYIDVPFEEHSGRKVIGVTAPVVTYSFIESFSKSWTTLWNASVMIYQALWNMIRHPSMKDIGGPVAIAHTLGQAARAGVWVFISYLALISLNLGLFNLLPLPALDGSHALLAIIEALTGKKMPAKAENWLHLTGFVLLIGFILVVTGNDILKIWGN